LIDTITLQRAVQRGRSP